MKPIVGFAIPSAIIVFAALTGFYLAAAEPQSTTRAELLNQSNAGVDRRIVVDAEDPPYPAIGKFRGAMTCTAAIVLNPRIVVTSSHCITNRDGTLKISDLLFEPGYQAGRSLGQFKATLAAVGSKQNYRWETVQEASQDWAILILDRSAKGVQPLGLSPQPVEALRSLGPQILMPAYSIDLANAERIGLDPSCSVRDEAWDVLVHDCRASFGSSGAPLLIRHGQQYAIVGIHTGSLYAGDEEGRVGRFIGNRAISSNSFAATLMGLSKLLDADHFDALASGT